MGINLVVSKTFCWKKKPCIYYATCIICKFVLAIWFPLHSEEVSMFLNELWGNESMYISDHPAVGVEIFDPIEAFACDNRSSVSVLHAFRAKKCTIRNVFASFLPSRAVLEANRFIHLSPASNSLVKMYHLIAMKWKWLVFINHDWCMFWSLMLFKVFLTSAFFVVYIFSASTKLKTKQAVLLYYIFSRFAV